MKKIFTLIAGALMAVGASAQVQTLASYTVTTASTLAGDNNTPDAGTGCTVQLHGTTIESKDNTNFGLKLDSDTKYVQIDLTEALQEGDKVNISYFMGSNGSADNTNGVLLTNAKSGEEGYNVYATMYAQIADKKNVVTKAYTAAGGEKKFIVLKISESSSVYFHKVEVTRGSEQGGGGSSKIWDFGKELSSADNTIITSSGWTTGTADGKTYYTPASTIAAKNEFVSLGLAATDGLTFTRDNSEGLASGRVRIVPGEYLYFNGSKVITKIASLGNGDEVKVRFKAGGDSGERSFAVTGGTPATISAGVSAAVDATITASGGDLTLSTSNGIFVYAITVNAALPTGIQTVKAADVKSGAAYNLAGQKVSEDYKGVVIQNGKKMLQK